MKNFIREMLSENGTISAMRFCMVLVFSVLMFAWLMVCLARKGLPEIPPSVITLCGLLIGGKVIQKSNETKDQ